MKKIRGQGSGDRSNRQGSSTVDFGLYLITDRKLTAGRNSLTDAVKEALKGGVRAIQLREKDMGTRELLKLAYKMRGLTERYGARLFINDRLDVALAVNADGIHLTQKSIPADAVRKVLASSHVRRKMTRFLVGVSTHSLKEARVAEREGADFITLGPVYRTPSKRRYGEPVGLDTLKTVCRRTGIPVFALGGIKSDKVQEVRQAGAFGVAMISEIFSAENIQSKTGEIVRIAQ